MNKQALKAFITDFYDAWKARDKAKIFTFYDKNLRAYADFRLITVDDIAARFDYGCQKFAESHYLTEDMFIDEDDGKIAIRMKQRHVLSDGSGDLNFETIMLYKIENNKITELWMSYYPNAEYLENN